MKLVQTHTGKMHKASEKTGRPVCASRSTDFESEFVALYPHEGQQSEIDCKRCLAKIKKYELIKLKEKVINHFMDNPCLSEEIDYKSEKIRLRHYTKLINGYDLSQLEEVCTEYEL